MIKVIANADDFGKSHEVNLGILDGFKRGMLQRTTLMVNMPLQMKLCSLPKKTVSSTRWACI